MNVGSAGNSQMMAQMRQTQQQMQQLRQDADVDGSEGLNVEEFTSLRGQVSELTGRQSNVENVEEVFAAIDTDGSGELSDDEMQIFHQEKMEGKGGKPPPRGGPPPGGMMSAEMNSTLLLFQEVESDSETEETSLVDTLFSNDEETEETSTSSSILDALGTEDEAAAA